METCVVRDVCPCSHSLPLVHLFGGAGEYEAKPGPAKADISALVNNSRVQAIGFLSTSDRGCELCSECACSAEPCLPQAADQAGRALWALGCDWSPRRKPWADASTRHRGEYGAPLVSAVNTVAGATRPRGPFWTRRS